MTRRLERLLQIDELIRGQERQTSETLAAELERTDRTIRSDIAFLRDRYHAPVKFTPKEGWHYTDTDWRLPTIPLTQGELFALTLGARMLGAYAGSTYEQPLRSAIEQLANRLPDETRVDLQEMARTQVLFSPRGTVAIEKDTWEKLMFAWQTNRQVKMKYFTAQRTAETERVVDPYIIYFGSSNNPFMSGFCHNRQDIRDFRIDRIRELEVLTTEFERRSDFEAQSYLETPFFHERGGEATEIRIWFDPPTAPYIKERDWHQSHSIEEHEDQSITLQFVAHGLAEVKRWVMFYGASARVLEPPELVEIVREEVQGMYKQYHEEEAEA